MTLEERLFEVALRLYAEQEGYEVADKTTYKEVTNAPNSNLTYSSFNPATVRA